MNLNLSTADLADGTTVTLTLASSLASSVNIYNGIPGASGTTVILGKDAGGTTSYTFTVGGVNPPPTPATPYSSPALYAAALADFNSATSFLAMQVQVPPAGAVGDSGAAGAEGPTGAATQPVAATQPAGPDIFTQLHDAIAKHDWASADKLAQRAETAYKAGALPTDGKQTNPNDKLHIVVSMLGKTDTAQGAGGIFLAAKPQKQKLTFKQMGLPDFPGPLGYFSVPPNHEGAFITESVLVQVVNAQGGDTGGYRLHQDVVNDVLTYDNKAPRVVQSPQNPNNDDWGLYPFSYLKFKSGLVVNSGSSNWYIDTPLTSTLSRHQTGRFFQVHVHVTDKDGNTVPGLDATFGFAFRIHYNNLDYSKSTVTWKIWGQKLGVDVTDPNQPVNDDPVKVLETL